MSGLAIQNDKALFFAEPDPVVPVEQQQQPAAPVTDTPSVITEVDQKLELGASGIGDDIDALEIPEGQPQTPEPTPDTPVDPTTQEGFTAFSEQFQKYVGVDLKEAMTSYQSMTDAASRAGEQLSQLRNQVAAQQQRLDIQVAWSNDPEVQQLTMDGNTTLSTVVEQRLVTLRGVYSGLTETQQQRIDALGSGGILQLWSIYKKRNGGSSGTRTLPGSTATPPAGAVDSDLMKLSDIINMSDNDYRSKGLKLLASKQFINDLGQ